MEKELTPVSAWSVLEHLQEGVILAEPDGLVRYLNEAARYLCDCQAGLRTLADIAAIGADWGALLTAPGTLELGLTNGRFLSCRSFPYHNAGADLVQIIIQPAQNRENGVETAVSHHHLSPEFETLYTLTQKLSSFLEEEEVIQLIGQQMVQAIGAAGYTAYRWQPQDNNLTILHDEPARQGAPSQAIGDSLPIAEDHPIYPIIINQEPVKYPDQPDAEIAPSLPCAWLTPGQPFAEAYFPLVVSEETNSLLKIVRQGEKASLHPKEMRLLAALANQASTALETAFIFQDTYEREQFYNALGSVSMAINFTLEQQTLLNLICDESLRIFEVNGAYIWQAAEGQFIGSAAKGFAEESFVGATVSAGDSEALVATIAQTGQATYINNLPQTRGISLRLPQQERVQAALGVPLETEGRIIGVLILVDTQNPTRFSHTHITRASIFGVQVAIALQNARLFEELRHFNEELDLRVAERTRALHEESNRVKILLRITSELSASLDQDHVLNQALHLVNEVANATQGVILLIDPETDEFVFRAALGLERPLPPRGAATGMLQHEGLAGWIIENRSAVIVNDTSSDPRWVNRPQSTDHRAVLGVPLITNEEVIGVLMLFHSQTGAFTMQQLDLVEAAAIQVANAINNANLYLLIRDQAERLGRLLHAEQIETAKNQAILESIADGVLVADSHSKIILGNKPASTILDIPRQRLIGKSINELLGLYGHSSDSWIKTIENWAEDSGATTNPDYLADQLTIQDRVISVHLSPVVAGKQFFGTVSIFRDITKEVEVDRLKSEFVSTVSHELRTPMTSIKGYADLMLMGAAGKMTPPQERYLKVIKNNADRLHMLVNDLLNISRIETGKITLDIRPLDIPQVIEQVVEGHLRGRIQHEQKNLEVTTDIEPSLPLVNADHARVTQILTNLIDNAFNYTPEPGKIHLRVRKNNGYVYISVQDSGIGIAKDNLTRIFDRFFRSEDEKVQAVPGTGLGLAIVNSLIDMHGGELTVESNLGEGSVFTFNLPVVSEQSEPAP
jgi:signal transduction histidine kinase